MLQVRRRLTLYRDRIEIQANWLFGKNYCMSVKLADLTTRTSIALIRSWMVKRSIMVGALAVGAAVFLNQPDYAPWMKMIGKFCWGLAATCGMVAVMTFRKTPFVRFMRTDGKPGLDIANAGPHAGQFEDFIEKVKRQIRKCGS